MLNFCIQHRTFCKNNKDFFLFIFEINKVKQYAKNLDLKKISMTELFWKIKIMNLFSGYDKKKFNN